MVRRTRMLLIVSLMLWALSFGCVSAAASNAYGTPVGSVYSTDIVAHVDGIPVDSYNIGGRTAVACAELDDLGLEVVTTSSANTIEVWTYKVQDKEPTWSGQTDRPGRIVGRVYPSRMRVLVNGLEAPAYEIDGRTVIVIEEVAAPNNLRAPLQEHAVSDYLLSYTWDPAARRINLFSLLSVAQSPYEPVSVVYDSISGETVGLDKADSVYEWFRSKSTPQGLAVFTGTDWEAGPLGDLRVGAAYIGLMYGRVVCREVTPDTAEFLSKYKITLPVHATGSNQISGSEAIEGFDSEQEKPFNFLDSPVWRGHFDPDAPGATNLTGVLPDGTQVFSWRWNGEAYERDLGSTTVTASAIVVMRIFEGTGYFDSGLFPDGLLAGMGDPATVFAEGRVASADWVRYATMWTPYILEYRSNDGRWSRIRLPLGTVWFEILTEGCTLSYK